MAARNPLVFDAVGQETEGPLRILAILWEGATTPGDVAEVRHRADGEGVEALLWPGRANDTQTYQGVNFGPYGIHSATGIVIRQLSAGRVLVYRAEG